LYLKTCSFSFASSSARGNPARASVAVRRGRGCRCSGRGARRSPSSPAPGPTPTPTPTPPPLFGRNVPLQSGGLFGQQPAAIVPPTPVPTPVLTPEPPVPMFGSTLQATPTPTPQFGQITPEGQILPPTGDKGLTGVAPRAAEPLTRTCPFGNVWDPKAMICVPDVPPLDLELCPDGSIPQSTGPGGIRSECPPFEAE
jgi:hypothetical protein